MNKRRPIIHRNLAPVPVTDQYERDNLARAFCADIDRAERARRRLIFAARGWCVVAIIEGALLLWLVTS